MDSLDRATLGVRVKLGHSQHFFHIMQLLTQISPDHWTNLGLNINLSIKRSPGNGPIYTGNMSGGPGGPGNLSGDPGNMWLDTKKNSTDPKKLWTNPCRFPGISGNFNPFLHTFPGSPDRFPGPPGSHDMFLGYIGPFPGLLLMGILIFNPRLVQWSGGKISISPSKEVKEMDQYAQETCHDCQDVQETCLGIQEMYN